MPTIFDDFDDNFSPTINPILPEMHFNLNAKVIVTTNSGMWFGIFYGMNNWAQFPIRNDIAILKSYDITELDNNVGDGYSFVCTGTTSPKGITNHTDFSNGENFINWFMSVPAIASTNLSFVYKSQASEEIQPMFAQYIDFENRHVGKLSSGIFRHYYKFLNTDDNEQEISIMFTSRIRDLLTDENRQRRSFTPFYVVQENSHYFLYLNPERNYVEDGLDPDFKYECVILIYDKNHKYFKERDIEKKKLELPSIYKPFYTRALVLIENDKINTRVVGNIFNGIGYRDDSGVYNVGKLSVSVNDKSCDFNIKRNKPTLLCNYDESINTFTTFTKTSSETDPTDKLMYAVTNLSDIKIAIDMTESSPPQENTFIPDKITYNNSVSFYEISPYTAKYGYYETGSTAYSTFNITLKKETFKGTSSNGVKYYFVSENFWHKFYKRITTSEYVYKYEFKDMKCNMAQEYELTPNLKHEFKDTPDREVDNDESFLSFYGVKYFNSWKDYETQVKKEMTATTSYYLAPQTESYVIEINVDEIMNMEKNEQTFTFYSPRTSEFTQWLIIGITDPLIDLVGSDSFTEEITDGNILPPHKDFVTIMTIAKEDTVNK